MPQKTVQLTITGKVQGVFFRKYTKSKAIELGVTGFVKNQFDGSVYIEATADSVSHQKFIEWCNHGPDMAKVDEVQIVEIPLKNFSGFEITF
jgi:acylphosphatase